MQKYEIYLQVIRGEVTMAEAAAATGVDRDDGGADPAGRQGRGLYQRSPSPDQVKAGTRDVELHSAKAEIARLSENGQEMAVKLMLVEGKGGLG